MISIYDFIFFSSIFIWVFPPFRNFRTFFFWYFLVLAVNDGAYFIIKIFSTSSNFISYLIISYILLIVLQKKEFIKKYYLYLSLTGILIIFLSFYFSNTNLDVILFSLIHLSITIRILFLFILYVANKRAINIFYLVLIFYELTVLIKFLNYFSRFNIDAIAYFYITTIFELLLGLFFSIFREDNPRLVFQLK